MISKKIYSLILKSKKKIIKFKTKNMADILNSSYIDINDLNITTTSKKSME